MKKVTALALVVGVAIALTGCTDSDATTPSPQASGELRQVRVAALPIAETAALWGGIEAGIFAKHGLEVEVLPAQGGAQAIPALINGDIDFAIGQPFGPFRADLQNLGVVIVGNYASSYADGDDINAVVALGEVGHHPAGPARGPQGLGQQPGCGRRCHDHGSGREGRRRPVEDQVRRGRLPGRPGPARGRQHRRRLGAGTFVTQLRGRGDTVVVAPYQATIPGLATLTTITRRKLRSPTPQLVADFSAAMKETLQWAKDPANEASVRQAIKDNLKLPDGGRGFGAAAGFRLGARPGEPGAAGRRSRQKYGVLDRQPDFDRLIQQQ